MKHISSYRNTAIILAVFVGALTACEQPSDSPQKVQAQERADEVTSDEKGPDQEKESAGGETSEEESSRESDEAASKGNTPYEGVVTMTDSLDFKPERITVKVGETVKWRNDSALVHTVTDRPDKASLDKSYKLPDEAEPWGSGRLSPGETYEHTFDVPGEYKYFCIPHEGAKMYGWVTVEPTR